MLEFINSSKVSENTNKTDTGESTANNVDELPNTTVGNWVMENSGALPRPGEEFTWGNLRIKISRVQRHRVVEVTVKRMGSREWGDG
jgi:CBS domain containing-hemolysin-like protein